MPMVSPLDLSVRPEDKAFDFFTRPLEDPFEDLFDQYINLDPFESSQSLNDSSASGELEVSFEAGNSSSGSEPAGPSPTAALNARHAQSHQPCWSTGWPNQQNLASSSRGYQTFVQQHTSNEATYSDVENLSLEGILRPSITSRPRPSSPPSTPPSTASRRKSKSAVNTPKTIRRRELDSRRISNRNSSSSPRMMRPSHYHAADLPSYHEWTQRFENFNLDAPADNLPMSPPPSTRVSQDEKMSRFIVPEAAKPNHTERQGQRFSVPAGSVTSPVSPPTAQMHRTQRAALQRRTTTDGVGYSMAMYPLVDVHSPRPQSQSRASWIPAAEVPTDFDFDAPSSFQPPHEWWPTSVPQPSHSYYQSAPTTTKHASRGPPQLLSDPFASQGLLISCEPSGLPDQNPFVAEDPAGNYFITASSDIFHHPSATEQIFSPRTTSPSNDRATRRSHHQPHAPPSRSPSASPTSTPHPPSNTHSNHNHNHNHKSRRPSSKPPSSHHRRKSSTNPHPPKTPTMPSTVGFVNFTPHDSKKILTGVAPSGSSKTKARREKEANERRRKLSLAAVRAVKEAGGDVGALKAEGLLI